MRRGRYEILISAPDDTFVDKSFGVWEDYDSAVADAEHYRKIGMVVKVYDQERKTFLNLNKKYL